MSQAWSRTRQPFTQPCILPLRLPSPQHCSPTCVLTSWVTTSPAPVLSDSAGLASLLGAHTVGSWLLCAQYQLLRRRTMNGGQA